MNPCGEIMLGEPEPVMPWVQIQWMNFFRVRNGQQPYTIAEIEALEKELTDSR